jgi:flagellar basal-body rod modification protein FlgD
MSLASVAAQQSNALAAAQAAATSAAATNAASASSASSSGTAGAAAAPNPLVALSSNFSDFLQMLMTQLKNQDPTSPMDTNEFTSELVQFSGVEQQINTNGSLTQLIQLTQAGETMQGTSMTGKQVTVQSTQIAVQNGSGTLNFNDPTAGPVAVAITNSAGQQLYGTTVNATAGNNTWTWNGETNSGSQLPDGAYNAAVVSGNANGSTTTLPFTVTGTATGVQSLSSGMQLNIGALSVPFSAVQSVGN